MTQPSYGLHELAQLIGAALAPTDTPDIQIHGLATLANAVSGQVSFFHNPRYLSDLRNTQASAVIVSPAAVDACMSVALVVDDPQLAYAKVATLFAPVEVLNPSIHSTAVVASDAVVSSSAFIGPSVVIEAGAIIEKDAVIHAGCVIGAGSYIGPASYLHANVTIYPHVKIGARVILHSGVVIGSDGFGMAREAGRWLKIPQFGSVIIEDDVDIGANTVVDRGALEDTIIETGVKIDNLVQIAHNVRIGAHTVIAGCVGIAGSTQIGRHCMIGGASGISGHLTIADGVVLAGMSMVTNSIANAGVYASGTGLLPQKQWQKSVVRFRKLGKS